MLILFFGGPALSFGQTGGQFCDSRLKAVAGASGYAGRGNRCEGMYQRPTGGEFEVVSLMSNTLEFDFRDDVVLLVFSPYVRQAAVKVRAVGLPLGLYYQMDAVLQPGDTLRWSTKEVLYPQRLNADRIGVYGWIGAEDEKVFVPLQVVQEGKVPSNEEALIFAVRPDVDVVDVRWRHAPVDDGSCARPSSWESFNNLRRDPVTSAFDSGEMLPLLLPDAMTEEQCVDVFAREPENPDYEDEFVILRDARIRRSDTP